MSIFNLHAAVLDDYRDLVRSFFSIADDRARDDVERALVAVWIEVHPASTSEVTTLLNKLRWLKTWLKERAPALYKLTASQSYYWLATRGVHIRQGSPQARQLRLAGLSLPRKRVTL